MQGLTLASLKKNPVLIPLFFCIGLGAVGSTGYLMRLALRSPDVTWSNKNNPEPWNEFKDKQYKLYANKVDYEKLKSPAPEY